jgi:hypothetical protein
MQLPFTSDQFFEVFRLYNAVVWPTQLLLYGLGCAAVALAAGGGARRSRYASALLAVLWIWTGAAYHLTFFAAINPAAYLFGALCIAQGALLIHTGVLGARLSFRAPRDRDGVIGASLVAYALVLYPLLGVALGHRFPSSPTFGVPCPTTIFTFGLLFWTARSAPRALLVIPLLWALVGTVAALQLGMLEDFGLTVAAALTVARLLPRVSRARLAT